ncbi:MAG: ribosomal protein S18-alanine N-acetyltransferase [Clostridia bacterium]|nr:ribosomal protein S18-alanine N-acetyltransferase [Clostridia bacterium]
MLIKKLSKQEIGEVFEISQEQFDAKGWQFELFEEELGKPDHYAFVGKVGKETVCFLFFMFTYGIKGEEYNILNLATKSNCTNKGFATEMLNFLADFAKKNKVLNLWLEVRQSNQTAIDLYKTFGFEIDFIRKRYYSDGENALIMSFSV